MVRQELRGWHGNSMPRYAAVTGWGSFLPSKVLTNKDLEVLVETTDEWIRLRTGIAERRIAETGQTTVSMAAVAAKRALERAHLAARDVDLLICATTTPDHLLPATGCLIQAQIGAVNAAAFDLNAACTGFLYGLVVGAQFIQCGRYERVLIVAGETLSRFLNPSDRNTCVLFGDGAGAVVLEATDQECGVLSTVLGCRGDADHLLAIEAGGSAKPATCDTVANGEHYVRMRGNEIFKLAVRGMSQASKEALARANVTARDLRKVIPHQANERIIKAAGEALGLPWAKMFINVHRYGNTGAASVPIALCEFLDTESAETADNLLLVAFGGGLTWAATVICWADVEAIVGDRSEEPRAALHQLPVRVASS
jgi:3-oxoacyl-[acyl-carrier-protein] synthase-3